MKGLLIYQPTSKSAPLADFIDGLDPRLREKILLRLYFLTQLEKPEMKEPHFKRFSIERYRWGTASFLNSYTYTSATGADADAVLKTALAQSGMGELDAQQLENFKWMMTYIVDYKGDIPGSLFMAAQTYVWDHQTFKGEGDGDIDGGGYANADTYETYLGYIDWMLAEKQRRTQPFRSRSRSTPHRASLLRLLKMTPQNGQCGQSPA